MFLVPCFLQCINVYITVHDLLGMGLPNHISHKKDLSQLAICVVCTCVPMNHFRTSTTEKVLAANV